MENDLAGVDREKMVYAESQKLIIFQCNKYLETKKAVRLKQAKNFGMFFVTIMGVIVTKE